MSITVTITLNGVSIPVTLDDDAIAAIAAAIEPAPAEQPSLYMTISEAAEFLRCSRQRVDDLLSQGRLTRFKDGARTLIRRTEVEGHLSSRR